MNTLFLRLLILFNNNSIYTPKSLTKKEEKEEGFIRYETLLNILFTILLSLIIISIITGIIILAIHITNITGTEANTYQRLVSVVVG